MKTTLILFFALAASLHASVSDLSIQLQLTKGEAEKIAAQQVMNGRKLQSGLMEKDGILAWYVFFAQPDTFNITEVDVATLNGKVIGTHTDMLLVQTQAMKDRQADDILRLGELHPTFVEM